MAEFRGIELIQSQLIGVSSKEFHNIQDDLSAIVQWHVVGNAQVIIDMLQDTDYDAYLEFFEDDREPLEFWAVSDWLAVRLRNVGEVVKDIGGVSIWGRQCSGQAIYMDTAFGEAACYSFDKG